MNWKRGGVEDVSRERKRKANRFKPFESPPAYKFNKKYVSLPIGLLESGNFRSLSSNAKIVYIIIKLQYNGEEGAETVICPHSTIKKYGLSSPTITKAIKELEQKGFIEIEEENQGGLLRKPNRYTLSSKWWSEEESQQQ